ncbi:ribosomal protein S18-alanine N-acetyltransferase [Chelativorans salis]|uniref:Ribosomal protein S18-alanine N-acetyltransferase n=1 Tax=Chelativorans salis TaxID=2978478 RepID=A0ABT2LIE0_9HYPH|nr:ribosomal protein S18-alanine N-acetyltransferase [Chelativorans sp. EGI FJ00035]MCT7374332.1 ribosomal protein S18-alanine N-acetyltransferase [Chelativorans sp. EGI FJ00035]
MALSFTPFRRRDFIVRPLESEDSEAIAALHAEDFTRPWTGDEFAALIAQDTVFGFVAMEVGAAWAKPSGFVLARLAAGEAEILTIAVSRHLRGRGLGRMLLDAVLRTLHAERAEALFLEVDENNQPAIALYRRLGFREVGRRPHYYENNAAARTDALVMRRDLR